MKILFLSLLFVVPFSSSAQLDIVLTSRFWHPNGNNDTLRTLEALDVFGATRLDWMYYNRQSIPLDSLKKRNITYSLTLNPMTPDSAHCTTPKIRVKNMYGEPYIAPWMREWKSCNLLWGCVNNPEYKTLFLAKSKILVDKGAYAIMVDDGRFNDQMVGSNGENCFCDHCVSGFNKYLEKLGKLPRPDYNYKTYRLSNPDQGSREYRDLLGFFISFQQESVLNFLDNWRKDIKAYSNNKIILMANNYGGQWNKFYNYYDRGLAELPYSSTTLASINQSIASAIANRKKQEYSYATDNLLDIYKCYLHIYLQGESSLIPWDLLLDSSFGGRAKRYYVKPADFVPLINFMKANAGIFSNNGTDPVLPDVTFNGDQLTHFTRFDGKSYFVFAYSELQNPVDINIVFPSGKYTIEPVVRNFSNPKPKKRIFARTTTFTGKLLVLKVTPK